MDRKHMIGEVAARYGIRLEEDDPAFLLVTLAELMLRDAQDQFAAATRTAIAEYEEAAERVQKRAGKALAVAVRYALDPNKTSAHEGFMAAPVTNAAIGLERQRGRYEGATWPALAGLVLFLSGAVVGRMFL
jgi:hypothetical protein